MLTNVHELRKKIGRQVRKEGKEGADENRKEHMLKGTKEGVNRGKKKKDNEENRCNRK